MLQVIPVASGRDMLKMLTKEQLYDLQKSRGIQTVECVKYTYVIRRRNVDMLIKSSCRANPKPGRV